VHPHRSRPRISRLVLQVQHSSQVLFIHYFCSSPCCSQCYFASSRLCIILLVLTSCSNQLLKYPPFSTLLAILAIYRCILGEPSTILIRKAILNAGLPYSTHIDKDSSGLFLIGDNKTPLALELVNGVCCALSHYMNE
jgi:hypothetical protein